jgi:glycosyltransferase involved in cell wall biosynthesis
MKLKIAELSPIAWRTPPKNYGPWEQVVSTITEGLVKKGHDVTLFATKDSITSAKLIAVCPRPYNEDSTINTRLYECWHNSTCYEMADKFDIIHNNFDFPPLTYSKLVKTPTVTTVHGFNNPEIINLYRKYKDNYFISISYADRKHAPDLNWIGNVYHGIQLEQFNFNNNPQDYLLFLGRISRDKGTHLAIEVAKKANKNLIISGIIPPEEKEYYEKLVKPNIDGKQIKFVGPADPIKRDKLFRNAYATLHMINFDEPFGLTLVESMACGTPVIAINRGSIPEVIKDGVTGFVVKDINEAISKVSEISKIDRANCRKRVEENFTVDIMVDNYIKIFFEIVNKK